MARLPLTLNERVAAWLRAYAAACYLCHAPAGERCRSPAGHARGWSDPHRGRNDEWRFH